MFNKDSIGVFMVCTFFILVYMYTIMCTFLNVIRSAFIYIYIPLQILTNALQTCPGVNRTAKIQMAPTVAVVSGSMNWLQTENLVQVEI